MITADSFEKPDGIYALSHSVGPMTIAARKAVDEYFFASWAKDGGDAWPSWLGQIDHFCAHIGQVINASQEEVCPQVNLASGFYSFLTAIAKLEDHKHKNTILMHKDAFASMGFVVSGLAKTFNLKLELIDGSPNCTDTWLKAFEKNQVLACLITHVHSNTSVKSEVATISGIAKAYNAFVCVDIAQSIGIVPIDVKKWRADAVFGSCVKWLCGGPGAGFMYVREALIRQLDPDPVGWFSHENPFEFDISHYIPADSAKRFWGGTPSIAPYVIAGASIKALLEIGLENLVTHNLKLKAAIVNDLPSIEIFESLKTSYRNLGGSLCIGSTDVAHTRQSLIDATVKFDERNSIFRISMHAVNTMEEAAIIAACFNKT